MMGSKEMILLLAVPLTALGFVCLFAPDASRRSLLAFHRNRFSAWLLSAIGLLWAAAQLYQFPMGRFEPLKPLLLLLTPLSFAAVVYYADELLAPRALGGLMLLFPAPIIQAFRFHDSSARYVPLSLCYGFVVLGLILVMSPHKYRHWMMTLTLTPGRTRLFGGGLIATGLSLAGAAVVMRISR